MGFYGNITNTSKTQFQFDKIYANRYDMERQRGIDGIYAGRYVLIEYDTKFQHDDLQIVFIKSSGIYTEDKEDKNFEVKPGIVQAGDVVFTADVKKDPAGGTTYDNVIYYEVQITNEKVTLKELASTLSGPNYTVNYNIDIGKFGAGRGYDSTVWQKTYMDGQEKYIMIAELNSVVPTFDVSADAPTMAPLVPHFDTQSTDIYYKLHWQPSWGFRIAEAAGTKVTSSIDSNSRQYPSDVTVSYDVTKYNPSTGENDAIKQVTYNGAIFFNKAGFNSLKHSYYDSAKFHDEIAIRPSGKSGQTYNKHNGTSEVEAMPDIQEMRVILPSLGNALCELWDIIYDNNSSNNTRYQDIEWKDAETGQINTAIGGMTRNPQTLAGCINIAHDLMGMIVTKKAPDISVKGYDKQLIYKDGDKYYRIQRNPLYKTTNYTPLSRNNNETDQEYNKKYKEDINKKFGTDAIEKVWYAVKTQNGIQIARRINIYTASDLEVGEKLGYCNGYSYDKVEIKEFAKKLSTVNGLILQLKDLLESDNTETRNTKTVQGVINNLNDIINIFEDLIPGEPVIVDASGKVTSANWTTQQTINYTNVGGATAPNSNTAENQWVQMSIDKNNKLITLQHKAHTVNNTNTSSNKNGNNNDTGLNKNTSDTTSKDKLKLYTPILDNCGHIVGKNTETVTLPYGYKALSSPKGLVTDTKDLYITINNKEDGNNTVTVSTKIDSSCSAKSTQDTIKITPVNKWIQTKVENDEGTDTIKIAHGTHAIITAAKSKSDLNGGSGSSLDDDNITLQDLEFDEAGHVTHNQKHTYTLPYGYKTISTSKINNTNDKDLYTTITPGSKQDNTADTSGAAAPSDIKDCIAKNTQDKLTISPVNKWIQIKTINDDKEKGDVVELAHEIHAIDGTSTETDLNNAQLVGFVVKDLAFDNAGHATKNITHRYTLPFGYKTIKFKNYNEDDQNYTSIIAENKIDTIGLQAEDRWITLGKTSKGKNITIVHASAGEDDKNKIKKTTNGIGTNNNNATLKFSSSFKIPQISYDTKGHIISNASQQITLQQPSVNKANSADSTHSSQVVTSISLPTDNATEGKFVYNYDNISDLKLTSYENKIQSDSIDISTGDSIKQAFQKVESKIASNKIAISDEVTINRDTAITKAIESLDVEGSSDISASRTIQSWSETDGKVNIVTQDIKITDSNIDDATISMAKIKELTATLDGKQAAGNYEISGAAFIVKKDLTGTDDGVLKDKDNKNNEVTVTLAYLLSKIKALESEITTLKSQLNL